MTAHGDDAVTLEFAPAVESVRQLLYRYCRAVDRMEWDAVLACYHPDAVDDHGTFKGTAAALVDWMRATHPAVARSEHVIGNVLVLDAARDALVTESTFAMARRARFDAAQHGPYLGHLCPGGSCEAPDGVEVRMTGRYLDRVERRAGTWRIARRVVVADSRTVTCTGGTFPMDERWVLGARGPADPSYAFVAEAASSERTDR